ncbi:MAG: hypothetical protein IT455_03740 [Planctomycetes bacterium]|nr:hypothetical protein [Planctomycetota bacterium]
MRTAATWLPICLAPWLAAQQAGGRWTVDDQRLAALVRRAEPAVEVAAGRRFKTPPVVVLADAGEAMRALRDELRPWVEHYFADNSPARIQRQLQLRADVVAAGLLGKYVVADRQVLMMPEALAPNLSLVGWAEADVEAVLLLLLVHELVHALQDQELGLAARTAANHGCDAAEAWSALIEGHAVLCSERAAALLGIAPAIAPGRALLVGHHDADDTPRCGLEMRRAVGRGRATYLDSAALLAGEFARGGTERLWRLLATPLPSSWTLLGPGPGAEPPVTARTIDDLFDGMEARERLGGVAWTIGRGDASALALLLENPARREELVPVLRCLRAGGEWFGMGASPAIWRHAWALQFTDEAAARSFVDLAEDATLAKLEAAAAQANVGPAVEGAWARSIEQEPDLRGGHCGARLCWWQRGTGVVQVALTNAPLADAALAAVAEALLAKLGAAR